MAAEGSRPPDWEPPPEKRLRRPSMAPVRDPSGKVPAEPLRAEEGLSPLQSGGGTLGGALERRDAEGASGGGRGGVSAALPVCAMAEAARGPERERDLGLSAEQRERKAKYPPLRKKYEYLDHTADVQLHSWGDTLEEAFEQCAMAMFGYITDTETVEPLRALEVEAEGHDLLSLLFHFLDEWLYRFSAEEFFVPREVKVVHIDRQKFKIRSIGWGEEFSLPKHPQGTEVKAITYSAMQILEDEKPEVFVIVDI